MKILVLSDLYPPYYEGGHEIQIKMIADGLSKAGHSIYVLTSKYGIGVEHVENNIYRLLNYNDRTRQGNLRYHHIRMAFLGRMNYLITNRVARHLAPDIVYAGQISHLSVFPMKAIQNYNVPIVHHLGNYFFVDLVKDCLLEKNSIKRLYRKIRFGFTDIKDFDFTHIITASQKVKNRYVEVGFRENNISVVSLASVPLDVVKKEEFRPGRKRQSIIRLLYVGRISQEKGVDVAVESLGHMVNCLGVRKITLTIIGDGDSTYIEKLNTLIDRRGVRNCVEFRSKMRWDDVLKLYSDYDILVFPSIWEEPFSGVLIEAMSQGVPIVATATGGTPELIKHGWNGLLVAPNDAIEMADRIMELVDNPGLMQRLSINGIRLIREKYTDKKIVDQIDKYLREVVKDRNPGQAAII